MFIMIVIVDKSGAREIRIQDYDTFAMKNKLTMSCENFTTSKDAIKKVTQKSGFYQADYKCVEAEKIKNFLTDVVGPEGM